MSYFVTLCWSIPLRRVKVIKCFKKVWSMLPSSVTIVVKHPRIAKLSSHHIALKTFYTQLYN